ncbi:MAG TPA: hypothetical protein VEA59_07265 [Patescibacteria group bacterium]|nr:hypothetical protein [Patescibacteria group bacterium]
MQNILLPFSMAILLFSIALGGVANAQRNKKKPRASRQTATVHRGEPVGAEIINNWQYGANGAEFYSVAPQFSIVIKYGSNQVYLVAELQLPKQNEPEQPERVSILVVGDKLTFRGEQVMRTHEKGEETIYPLGEKFSVSYDAARPSVAASVVIEHALATLKVHGEERMLAIQKIQKFLSGK